MMAEKFLLYLPDPFGVGNSLYAIATAETFSLVGAQEIGTLTDDLITYEASTLIDDLRRNQAGIPPSIIDMSEAIRLLTGLSRSDGGEPKWNFWRRIKRHFDSAKNWEEAYLFHESRAIRSDTASETEVLRSLSKACISLWSLLKTELASQGEHDRFFEIEIPVARIFYQRQLAGIAVDLAKVRSCLREASQEKYQSYRNVADHLKVSPTGLNYWNVSPYIPDTDTTLLTKAATGYTLRDQLKISADVSNFAKSFTVFMDASRDVDVLTRLSNSIGRVYPTFHPVGTISSRILVSDPHLQELRRKFRRVIAADDGYQLVYFDYSQFEPGIMASLSNDPEFISMYNGGDVYTALSRAIFGDSDHRDQCKRIFLAFSYGMDATGISKLVLGSDSDSTSQAAMEKRIKSFFGRFQNLIAFKTQKERELFKYGRVSTLLGNSRLRKSKGLLTSRERRWATSQTVQGTASLVFKTALIDIEKELDGSSILLPVHDAVLMQFSKQKDIALETEKVSNLMKNAFQKWCPQISARVSHGPFS